MFDIARGTQDDALVGLFQTDSGVASMGWFGTNMEMLWCASMTRGLTTWNTTTGMRELLITDFYPLYANAGLEVDYVVGCLTQDSQDPVVLCGSQDGTGFLMHANHPEQMISTWKGHQVVMEMRFDHRVPSERSLS